MIELPLFLHEMLCIYLVFSVFVRAVAMDRSAPAPVRFAFWALGLSALLGLAAPLLPGWRPDGWGLVITAAFALVQHTTGAYWRGSVPCQFLKGDHGGSEKADS